MERLLTLDEIRWVTVGALDMKEEDGVLHFYKCTPKQTEAFAALSAGLGERSLTTSGVRLDLVTDARSLRFTPMTAGKYSAEVDGLLCLAADAEAGKPLTLSLSAGEHRVTLWLPSHSVGTLASEIVLRDAAVLRPYRAKVRLLMIGDSLTQGWNSGLDTEAYAPILCRALDAHSVIQGIGGAYYHRTVFDPEIPFQPSLVTVAYGTNDFNHYKTVKEAIAEARAMLTSVKETYGGRRVAVILPPPRRDANTTAMGEFSEYRRALAGAAEELGLFTADGYELLPQMEEIYADSVHPNALGFAIMARRLEAILKKQFFFLR